MGFLGTLKAYGITTVSVISRTIYNAGQTLFSFTKVMSYFNAAEHPVAKAATAITLTGTVGATVLTKSMPTYHKLANTPASADEEDAVLGWGGTIVRGGLRASGIIYGGMTSLNAYFLTTYLARALDTLVSSDPQTATWKEALIQTGAVLVAIANFTNYYTNDYRFVKKNTNDLGQAVSDGHFACDAALLKTMGCASLNLVSYPMQAFFFARPALTNLPYVGEKLGSVGTGVLSGLASASTFLTVVSWLPSIYNHFANHNENHSESVIAPGTTGSRAYKIASYTTGTVDSLGGAGFGMYISVIFTLNTLFGLSPYGWIIGVAALCGLNAAVMNLLFSVKQGTQTSLELYFKPNEPSGDLESQPLLVNDGEHPSSEDRFYTLATPPGTVLFSPGQDGDKMAGTAILSSRPIDAQLEDDSLGVGQPKLTSLKGNK